MVLPRFQPTLGAYVYLLMHRFDEKDNSKPAQPTAHHDTRSRSSSPASGATPPPSGVGDPTEKENSHKPPHDGAPPRPPPEKENSKPAKPTAHHDHRNRAPSPSRGATPPPSGGGGPSSPPRPSSPAPDGVPSDDSPVEPDYPDSPFTSAAGLDVPGVFALSRSSLKLSAGYLAVQHRTLPYQLAITRVGPPMARVALVRSGDAFSFNLPFLPNGDLLLRGPNSFALSGPKMYWFEQYSF
jgi:hypothetical protein